MQEQVSGRDCHQTILIFGLRTEPPVVRRAIAQALSRAPGATALADVEIHRDLLAKFFSGHHLPVAARVDAFLGSERSRHHFHRLDVRTEGQSR